MPGMAMAGGIHMVNEELVASLPGIYLVGCATGVSPGYASITWLLAELKSMVATSDVETWRAVFLFLGARYAQLDRFEIVLGVLDALPDATEVHQWGPAWLESIDAANIHPLSVILCSTRRPSTIECALISAYMKANFPRDSTNLQLDRRRGKRFLTNVWRVILPANKVVSNLLSTQPVILEERHPQTVTAIGHGWAVPGLITGAVPALASLGEGLVVMGDAEFGSAPALHDLGHGTSIGGQLKVFKKSFVHGTSQKRYHPKGQYRVDCGLCWRGIGCACVDSILFKCRTLCDHAITIPDSWMILITGAGRD